MKTTRYRLESTTAVLLLSGAALTLFWTIYSFSDLPYFPFSPGTIVDAVPAMAGLMAAVFGIILTVVSIVVQLAANRYSGVTRLFILNRFNILVMSYYVVVCIFGVWLSLSVTATKAPQEAIFAMLVMTTLGLAITLPYFAFVFRFLEPRNIIRRIQRKGAAKIIKANREDSQRSFVRSIVRLTDIGGNSLAIRDKGLASAAVDSLRDLSLTVSEQKDALEDTWFSLSKKTASDPDFVAMDEESKQALVDNQVWTEWKVLRAYLGIFRDAMKPMPDLNYLLAINTRYIGANAIARGDKALVDIVIRFFNSYLRVAITQKEVRVAYNVLNQYRIFIEKLIDAELYERATRAAEHLKYYGHVSYENKLWFVTETVAYDISSLCIYAHEKSPSAEPELLSFLLDLDRPLEEVEQEKGLLGVRKAQVKLAVYYIENKAEELAKKIADDMRDEPKQRLQLIEEHLSRVHSKDFWEIIDRGRNFEYLPEEERKHLPTYFSWVH